MSVTVDKCSPDHTGSYWIDQKDNVFIMCRHDGKYIAISIFTGESWMLSKELYTDAIHGLEPFTGKISIDAKTESYKHEAYKKICNEYISEQIIIQNNWKEKNVKQLQKEI